MDYEPEDMQMYLTNELESLPSDCETTQPLYKVFGETDLTKRLYTEDKDGM